jgi:Ca2+-binding EF-hand superfamily protein
VEAEKSPKRRWLASRKRLEEPFQTKTFSIGKTNTYLSLLLSEYSRHNVWMKIAPSGKMNNEQFIKFIVENRIGTGLVDCDPKIFMISSGKEHDARSMFKMMDKDKNGWMEFDEFVLILVLPKSTEEITPEKFADCK